MLSRNLIPSTLKYLTKLKPSKNALRLLRSSFVNQSLSNILGNVALKSSERTAPLYFTTSSFHFSTQEADIPVGSGASSPHIVEVETINDFQNTIKEANTPIVLDCYATWCSPCRKLTPMLEKKAIEGKGKWILMKYDIDKIPQLTNALKIRSVPSVILINGGNAIDNFEGLPTDEVFENFFNTVEKLAGVAYSEEEHLKSYNQALKKIESQSFSEAITLLKNLQNEEQWLEKHGAQTVAALALSYIKSGDKNASIQCLSELKEKYEVDLEREDVKALIDKVDSEFAQKDTEASKLDQMKAELDNDPANNELRLNIAQYAIDNNLYEDAIETLLDIIKIDRNFKNRTANNKLLELFNKLGSTNPLVVQGRKKMQKILY